MQPNIPEQKKNTNMVSELSRQELCKLGTTHIKIRKMSIQLFSKGFALPFFKYVTNANLRLLVGYFFNHNFYHFSVIAVVVVYAVYHYFYGNEYQWHQSATEKKIFCCTF